ncbi:hypothetical protein LTR36_002953 [Oleoguttula mirabilis]|uniref:Uncharacterized protein n=1 Tax=Oleoguttula mirabilis TaxID=1507867 RepID=A0AAV9JY10_9PEZI|nr:hypothetical protein LTR36_002953 [Oleoguttula mirabilis]
MIKDVNEDAPPDELPLVVSRCPLEYVRDFLHDRDVALDALTPAEMRSVRGWIEEAQTMAACHLAPRSFFEEAALESIVKQAHALASARRIEMGDLRVLGRMLSRLDH